MASPRRRCQRWIRSALRSACLQAASLPRTMLSKWPCANPSAQWLTSQAVSLTLDEAVSDVQRAASDPEGEVAARAPWRVREDKMVLPAVCQRSRIAIKREGGAQTRSLQPLNRSGCKQTDVVVELIPSAALQKQCQSLCLAAAGGHHKSCVFELRRQIPKRPQAARPHALASVASWQLAGAARPHAVALEVKALGALTSPLASSSAPRSSSRRTTLV